MRIYIFKSETRKELRAFAGDPGGSKLPSQHGPWTVTGVVGPGRDPPYTFSRDVMQDAIDAEGFQLWRLGKKACPRTSGTVACRLEYRRWPEDDQAKSLFNSSLRASLPARLAA